MGAGRFPDISVIKSIQSVTFTGFGAITINEVDISKSVINVNVNTLCSGFTGSNAGVNAYFSTSTQIVIAGDSGGIDSMQGTAFVIEYR